VRSWRVDFVLPVFRFRTISGPTSETVHPPTLPSAPRLIRTSSPAPPPPAVVGDALRLARAEPNIAAGLRAAIAATLPLLLMPTLGHPELTWASLAGFNTIMVDKGGATRARAESMIGYALTGTAAVIVGTLASTHAYAAVGVVLVTVTACALLRLFGAAATSVGVSSAVTLVVALSIPSPDVHAAFVRAGYGLGGNLWALVLSLLWPIRPFRPARMAVAASFRSLAAFCEHFTTADDVRRTIETARETLGALRRGHPGTSLRGEQLVVLLECGDQLFEGLAALGHTLRHATERRIAACLNQLAAAIEAERSLSLKPQPIGSDDARAAVDSATARAILRASDRLAELVNTARALDGGSLRSGPDADAEAAIPDLFIRGPVSTILRAQLRLDSAMLRHALRMSVGTAVAVLLTKDLHLTRGYWTTLTCLVILQPHGSATLAKALQRVAGTVIGAAIAVAVATWIHDPTAILACVFVLIAAAVALMPINYALFAVFLTPSFVLLAERSTGDFGLARVRIVNTLLGAAIALAASRWLFPLTPRDELRPRIAEGVRALRKLLDVATLDAPSATERRQARNEASVALSNADASFQRRLTEAPPAALENEASLALILYSHRIASSLVSLARSTDRAAKLSLARHAPAVADVLDDLRDAIANRRPPRPLPDLEGLPETLAFDLAIQQAAAIRWQAAGR
jgi:uncharacterized membrane protein YccC